MLHDSITFANYRRKQHSFFTTCLKLPSSPSLEFKTSPRCLFLFLLVIYDSLSIPKQTPVRLALLFPCKKTLPFKGYYFRVPNEGQTIKISFSSNLFLHLPVTMSEGTFLLLSSVQLSSVCIFVIWFIKIAFYA